MAKLYIFRGKAATGKTTITDVLSKEFKICLLRKDDIYDMFTGSKMAHKTKK